MASTEPRGIKQIIQAGKWSIDGLKACYQYEPSFRLELGVFMMLFPISFWVAETSMEWLLLFLSMVFVLILEVVNSAIEAAVDMVCGDTKNSLAQRAKDMGSAAVFLSQLSCLLIWLVVGFQ